ncbi:MAG: hypothetical protein IT452_20160 [Planctomycetia bacterium]|nr:hypothetical protein [Planctomycetia bacterium]
MIFARRVFTIAGIYGLAVLLPFYGLEGKIGRDAPPAITHPEYFYGFLGVAVAWQVAFLLIGRDPARLRPLMVPAVLEKAAFGIAVVVLYGLGRVDARTLAGGGVDLLLGALFVAAFVRTRPADGRQITAG